MRSIEEDKDTEMRVGRSGGFRVGGVNVNLETTDKVNDGVSRGKSSSRLLLCWKVL